MMAEKVELPEGVKVENLPVVESGNLTEADERLIQRFTEIDASAIERLSSAGKSLVEWGTAALGVFFASLALLQNPSVLDAIRDTLPTVLGIVAVAGYVLAILCGFLASIPLRYRYSPHNLTLMEEVLQKAFRNKFWLVMSGTALFAIGSLSLGGLIVSLLLSI